MKRLAPTLLLISALLLGQSDSLAWLDYFPNHIGDRWLYRVTGPYTGQETYELVEVVGETAMGNGRTYQHFNTLDYSTGFHRSQFFRIDTATRYIYEYNGFVDTSICPAWEVLRFDFSLVIPFDSTLWCHGYQNCESVHYYYSICRDSGLAPIGIDTISAPYNTFTSTAIVVSKFTFSKGFGLTYWHKDEILIIAGFLVAAEINGIHYGEPFAAEQRGRLPATYHLLDAYPNPFNPATTIRYDLPHASEVSLIVYDLLGREVTTLVDAYTQPGNHETIWNAGHLSSGIYIARLLVPPTAGVTPGYTKSIKLVLLK
ncbi:T9SS type A sorting domain-containing protein [Candidatus Neomarinimicrobiota bacterium]